MTLRQCYFALYQAETANHLLAECTYTKRLWTAIIDKLGGSFLQLTPMVATPLPSQTLKANWSTQLSLLRRDEKKTWKSAICLASWMLWKERNNRVFNAAECTVP